MPLSSGISREMPLSPPSGTPLPGDSEMPSSSSTLEELPPDLLETSLTSLSLPMAFGWLLTSLTSLSDRVAVKLPDSFLVSCTSLSDFPVDERLPDRAPLLGRSSKISRTSLSELESEVPPLVIRVGCVPLSSSSLKMRSPLESPVGISKVFESSSAIRL